MVTETGDLTPLGVVVMMLAAFVFIKAMWPLLVGIVKTTWNFFIIFVCVGIAAIILNALITPM